MNYAYNIALNSASMCKATPLTQTCKGYCKDYMNVKIPRNKPVLNYRLHGVRRCATCEYNFREEDCSKFPNRARCVCCGRPLRTRTANRSVDWEHRYE